MYQHMSIWVYENIYIWISGTINKKKNGIAGPKLESKGLAEEARKLEVTFQILAFFQSIG